MYLIPLLSLCPIPWIQDEEGLPDGFAKITERLRQRPWSSWEGESRHAVDEQGRVR
jgi:hypothetical protein